MEKNKLSAKAPYLSGLGAWALAFGCAVGWGSFVMPGTIFLPIAGPIGTVIGIVLGGLIMLIIARNYHYLMNTYPDGGGAYTYTKKCFGYDHGFISAWFLILTYIAVLWANATALPLIARTLLGSTFQVGFHYEIAGYQIYMGELVLVYAALLIGALVCMGKKLAERTQIVMAIALFAGVVVCFIAAAVNNGGAASIEPAFSPDNSARGGIMTIFALAPWAYVGFESISHSAGEAKYPLKKSFAIMLWAIIAAAVAYGMLSVMAVSALPKGCSSWTDYISNLGTYSGPKSLPTIFSAFSAMGDAGSVILGVAAMCAMFTGIIGNYIALSRLMASMTDDGLFPEFIGKRDKNNVPRNAIIAILAISLILPLFGRTAISWIVDVTTIGATIAFAFTSAAAFKTASINKKASAAVFGVIGLLASVVFAVVFLVPNIISVTTLSTESYLILAAWCVLGYFVFHMMLRKDTSRRLGRSNVALIIMLGVIIFTSTVWIRQSTELAVKRSVEPIVSHYSEELKDAGAYTPATGAEAYDFTSKELKGVSDSLKTASSIQVGLLIATLTLLFIIYALIQKREKQIEIEKALIEETSRAKTSFLSNMSHEIRTPMNAIIGLDNIALRDPDLSPKTREQLEKIGTSANHLLRLINDVLDMSRIESGRMVLKSEEFLFREFIDQVNIIINGQCVEKGLNYECNIKGHVDDYYFGDDMKLKQVLINILGNSVKFTEAPGDVTFTVEQLSREGDECTLRFVMEDTGIGMDQYYLPQLFEVFSQEDISNTNRYGGSGLGMAITKNYVEMMDGTIEVESEKGIGSIFTVTVKLKASDRTFSHGNPRTIPEGMKALVVDDDEIACEHAQEVLSSIGFNVDTVTTPHEALDNLRIAYESGDPYRLLISDFMMPGMKGTDLAKEVRSFDNNETAIIIVTGYSYDILDDDVKEDGADGIITKPLFTDSLNNTIYSVFERKNIIAPAPEEETVEEAEHRRLKGRRILMAEDVDTNAEILADLLDLEDIESERARNGEIAVDFFASKPMGYYDAILMDVRMPVMDGLTATEKIRAIKRPDAKEIPIIAMTANVFDEDVERSFKAGMNAHLSKPIEPDKLYETLALLISRNSGE